MEGSLDLRLISWCDIISEPSLGEYSLGYLSVGLLFLGESSDALLDLDLSQLAWCLVNLGRSELALPDLNGSIDCLLSCVLLDSLGGLGDRRSSLH